MTASVIWSNRASCASLLGLALLAGGCAPHGADQAAQPPPAPPMPPPVSQPARGQAGLGLVPLPSPQQVSASVPLGRLDPFGNPRPPVVAPAAGSAAASSAASGASPAAAAAARGSAAAGAGGAVAPPGLPAGFLFNGVIATGGRPEALVQLGEQSGSVRVGDVGGKSKPWLPAGWTVAAIDTRQGTLTLSQGATIRRKTLVD